MNYKQSLYTLSIPTQMSFCNCCPTVLLWHS